MNQVIVDTIMFLDLGALHLARKVTQLKVLNYNSADKPMNISCT